MIQILVTTGQHNLAVELCRAMTFPLIRQDAPFDIVVQHLTTDKLEHGH